MKKSERDECHLVHDVGFGAGKTHFCLVNVPPTDGDVDLTASHFEDVLGKIRAGRAQAVFMVTVMQGDESEVYFAGDDEQEVASGLVAMATVAEWLAQRGVMLSSLEMARLGQAIRDAGDDDED